MVGIGCKCGGCWSSKVVRDVLGVVDRKADIQDDCQIVRKMKLLRDVMGPAVFFGRFRKYAFRKTVKGDIASLF